MSHVQLRMVYFFVFKISMIFNLYCSAISLPYFYVYSSETSSQMRKNVTGIDWIVAQLRLQDVF